MIAPKTPANEKNRLKAVKSYSLLDTLPESDYDNITKIIASVLDVPISLVTLLDDHRNYLKSHHGVPFNESPRDISFCGHAILEQEPIFIIEDARKDLRFRDNPLVTEYNAIFYAGVPLINPDGFALGTLCAFGHEVKKLTDFQQEILINLGKQVVNLFELRKKNNALEKAKLQLKVQNNNLKQFTGHVSHDMKMPLANMIISSDILKQKFSTQIGEKGSEYLDYIKKSALKLSDYINSLLEHYESDHLEGYQNNEKYSVNHILEDLIDLLNIDTNCEISIPENDFEINCNRSAIEQIFLNLIANSIKYCDKPIAIIKITSEIKEDHIYFEVIDNGIGIPEDKLNSIFELFSTVGNLDKFGQKGHGIGLSTVKKLVESLDGEITVNSELGKGTSILFSAVLN